MQMIPDDGHQTSARAIRVLRVVSTADSRIDRHSPVRSYEEILDSRNCIARTYPIQPSLVSAGFPKK